MSPIFLAKSFMTLYTCLLDEIKSQPTAEGSQRMSSSQVRAVIKVGEKCSNDFEG